jgi:hypothetical protein
LSFIVPVLPKRVKTVNLPGENRYLSNIMKKRTLLLTLGVALLAGAAYVGWNTSATNQADEVAFEHMVPEGIELRKKVKDKTAVEGWLEYSRTRRANQHTGTIDLNDMITARQEVFRMRAQAVHQRGVGLEWTFKGPDNWGGRTRDILFHKDNPNKVFTGGVSGGLWYSNNGGLEWKHYDKSDTLAGSGVVSLAQTTSGDIYVGTGENFSNNTGTTLGTPGFLGSGIWKSSDGGETFKLLPSTRPSANSTNTPYAFVSALAAHPTDGNTIIAGTNTGLKISRDGGAIWSNASQNTTVGGQNIQDVKIDPRGVTHVIVNGVYFRGMIDNPASFEFKGLSFPGKNFSRMAVNFAPSDPDYVYIIGCNSTGATNGIYRSTDAGVNWEPIAPTSLPTTGFNPTGSQGEYDIDIAVHPTDKNKVFVGGQLSVYAYQRDETLGTNLWWPISNWWSSSNAFDPQYVHADHHRIRFHPNEPNTMFVATDGGIFRTYKADVPYGQLPPFAALNKGFGIAQFYSVAAGIDGVVVGGTQDNGTLYVDFEQNTRTQGRKILGGDGAFSAISKTNPNALFYSTQFGSLRRSSNNGNTAAFFFDQNIDCDPKQLGNCVGDNEIDCGAPFVTAFELWENFDTSSSDYGEGRLFVAPYCGIWVAIDALDFTSNPTWFHIGKSDNGFPGGSQFYPCLAATTDGDILYVGSGTGSVYRISGLKSATFEYDQNGLFDPTAAGITVTQIASFGSRWVTEIAVDPRNDDHVVVTLGNYGNNDYVYRSTTAATTTTTGSFTSIQGNLPRMPVYSVVIDAYNPANIIVGTEMGIFSSTTAGNIWTAERDGMPTVPVFMLRQERIDDLNKDCYAIYAATHGRGMYATYTLTPSTCRTFTSVKPEIVMDDLRLFPNPVKQSATVSFTMEQAGEVNFLVYDLQGRLVKQQSLGYRPAGKQNASFSTEGMANGNYIGILRTENSQATVKFLVSR